MLINKEDLKLIADTVRTLTLDAVQKANSGHPGMAMGSADMAAVLWTKVMKYNPGIPTWVNRDRFILSAGHVSMLLYSMLHFSGYDYDIEDLKLFRQLNSKTPGHPEFNIDRGVETTTGPLGQGIANGVGMAYAARLLAEEFNNYGEKIIDHYIYTLVGDGCIMEGLTCEAASLAGHWGLGNLICIYDSNDISIEGDTNFVLSDNIETMYKSFNWHVQIIDGHDYDAIEEALTNAQNVADKPSLIIARTTIAKGSANRPKSGCRTSFSGAPIWP